MPLSRINTYALSLLLEPMTEVQTKYKASSIAEKLHRRVELRLNPSCANRNKSRLFFSSAEMFYYEASTANSVDQIRLPLRSLFWVHAVCFYT